jgi:hypothetical protein
MNITSLTTPVRQFNTGRHYGKKGQMILWAKAEGQGLPAGAVVFSDLDRGIDGVVTCHHHAPSDDMILALYDNHGYEPVSCRRELMEAARSQGLADLDRT